MSAIAPKTLLLADDHTLFREGLKLLLGTMPGVRIVAETGELSSLKALVQQHQPDLLLLDYHMPGGDTAALAQYLRQRYPAMRLVMLTGAASPWVLRQLVDLGADAVLLKALDARTLQASLSEVLAGKRVLPPEVQALMAQPQIELTRREMQILKLVYDGLSNAAIAELLSLSPKTVDKHRENFMRKMGVSSAPQLVRKVHELRLFEERQDGAAGEAGAA
ncbi:MAG: response regulator transcription factor [Curvibacter sp.]|nr:MAG: response regulator transcription factor [Curvibacter sp.]